MPLELRVAGEVSYFDDSDANTAMKSYWSAKQAGDASASLKRIDQIPAPLANRPEVQPGEVSDLAVARIQRQERMLADRGIALPPPVYAAGTKVVQLGLDNFRTSRQGWEDMPETVAGLQGVFEAVQSENREDFVVPVRALRMSADGRVDFGQGDIGLEANGLRALVSRNSELFPRGGELMAALDPEVRATVFNAQIEKVAREKRLKIRTREGAGGRQAFAVVSERYATCDADEIAAMLSSSLMDTGMRGEVVYDPTTTNLVVNGLLHADEVVDLAAGDVFKVGVQFRSNDAAGGSIQGRAIAWRNLCLNLIIIGTGQAELLRRKHVGAVREVLADVSEAAARAGTIFSDFADDWGVLRGTPVADLFEGGVEDALRELAESAELDVGVRRDSLVELLLTGWRREPGNTLADLVNAVTSAHLLSEVDQWQRDRFEEGAGRLVPVLAQRARA